jgi:hypothetical protein
MPEAAVGMRIRAGGGTGAVFDPPLTVSTMPFITDPRVARVYHPYDITHPNDIASPYYLTA